MRTLLVIFCVTLAATAHAQSNDVPALIKLIENQPNDMDRSTWKEKRRDAARKLGQSKDKRAVPVLINLADTETFDIIGDIAIEGLGNIKDQAAVPVLQRIAGDASRDKSSRELARKSLAKLGAPETGGTAGSGTTGAGSGSAAKPPPGGTGQSGQSGKTTNPLTTMGGTSGGMATGGGATATGGATTSTGGAGKTGGTSGAAGKTGGTTGGASTTGAAKTGGGAIATGGGGAASSGGASEGGGAGGEGGGSLGGELIGGSKEPTEVEGQPEIDDDVIAAFDRLTFAVGTAGLQYDTARKRMDFDGDVSASYLKGSDSEARAWKLDLGADVVAGMVNPDGRGVSRGGVLNVHALGEARFYAGQIYGVGRAAAALALQYMSYKDANDPNNDDKSTSTNADFEVAIGGGFGRVIDVGSLIRVRRLSRLLDDARALGKPIDSATSKRLQTTWWALRGERSIFRTLIATIAILREAGILLGEPNAVLTYEILTVLRDTQLYQRPSGFDAQVTFGEGYLYRPDDPMGGGCVNAICGRVEQLLANAGYGAQLDDDKLELSGGAYARYRLFAPDGEPSPWAAGVMARMRRFTYGEHGDPFGALDLRGTISVSDDANPNADPPSDKALRIEGELGFTYWMNQVSGLRLAAQLVEDSGRIYVGARLEATYGLLDATFAR